MRLKHWALLVLLLGTACAGPAVPAAGRITAQTVTVTDTQLTFTGTTDLADDACLLTALVYGTALMPDWPTDCVTPKQGAWTLTVAVGQKEHPQALLPGQQYEFQIWLRDHPETIGRLKLTAAGAVP